MESAWLDEQEAKAKAEGVPLPPPPPEGAAEGRIDSPWALDIEALDDKVADMQVRGGGRAAFFCPGVTGWGRRHDRVADMQVGGVYGGWVFYFFPVDGVGCIWRVWRGGRDGKAVDTQAGRALSASSFHPCSPVL